MNQLGSSLISQHVEPALSYKLGITLHDVVLVKDRHILLFVGLSSTKKLQCTCIFIQKIFKIVLTGSRTVKLEMHDNKNWLGLCPSPIPSF